MSFMPNELWVEIEQFNSNKHVKGTHWSFDQTEAQIEQGGPETLNEVLNRKKKIKW